MKTLLGCLMCLVLTMSQGFAISGGPWSGKGLVGVVGTYAGTLQDVMVGSNNLGIFTLSVPQTGLATGTLLLFTGERAFSGPITGLADPNTDILVATLQGIPVVSSGGQTIETLNFHADGSLNARIRGSKKSTSVSSVRIRGTAHVTTTNSNPSPPEQTMTDYIVNGFRQSSSSS
jgi:hypothetical protein